MIRERCVLLVSSSCQPSQCSRTSLHQEFACNGTVVEHPEYGEVIQLQGDQRGNICQFIKKVFAESSNRSVKLQKQHRNVGGLSCRLNSPGRSSSKCTASRCSWQHPARPHTLWCVAAVHPASVRTPDTFSLPLCWDSVWPPPPPPRLPHNGERQRRKLALGTTSGMSTAVCAPPCSPVCVGGLRFLCHVSLTDTFLATILFGTVSIKWQSHVD